MTPDEFRELLISYEPEYRIALGSLWAKAKEMTPGQFTSYAVQAYPEIITPHLALAAELAATWYDEQPSSDANYVASTADLVPVKALEINVRWALSTPSAEKSLDGSATRAFHNSARRTIVQNANTERGAQWARQPEPGACRFCQMFATRGAVYASEKEALYHAAAHGERPRKAAAHHDDERYHDHCRCIAVAVRPGGEPYKPPKYVAQYERDYYRAAAAVDKAGLTRNETNILNALRALDSN